MKRLFTFLMITLLSAVAVQAQRPDFSLVGFGVGTVGGTGGIEVQVKTYADLAANVTGTDKKILKINGTITGPNGGVILDIGSNKSIIGVGSTAMLSMINLHLKNSQQIIIQNLKMSMIGSTLGSDADMIAIETTSSNTVKYVWIDHCELFNIRPTLPETAAKKDLYDGMIDIKKSSSLITISWCYFHDHWKCSLIGFTDTDVYDRKITYHHNYFKNIKSRAPSYRGGTGHIYNNFFDGLVGSDAPTSDAINSREEACLKTESNYFKNYTNTIYTALDDVVKPGFAYGTNNIFENSAAQTAGTCSSFSTPYNYKMDLTANIPNIVVAWSGVGKLDGSVVTNIENVEISENSFSFYPSPVKDLLTMELNIDDISNSNLTIKDNTGKTVLTPKLADLLAGSNTLQIDMSQLKSGVYHCILFNGYKNISKTLVKE
jgi:pectate lyase